MALVEVRKDGRVAIVTLDDPERRNALTLPLVDELVAAVEDLEADDDVGAMVVTGAGPAFCAGADLGDLGGAAEAGLREIYAGFLRVARSTLPTIAAVNGPAVGAGMNLALACDVRLVAAERGRFETRFLDLGLHPGGGHTWMLERLAGPQVAAVAVLFGERLTGEDAVRAGVAWRSVPDEALLSVAVAMAARAASAPRELALLTKETLRRVVSVATHAEAIDVELTAQVWSLEQPFFADRLAALKSKISSK